LLATKGERRVEEGEKALKRLWLGPTGLGAAIYGFKGRLRPPRHMTRPRKFINP